MVETEHPEEDRVDLGAELGVQFVVRQRGHDEVVSTAGVVTVGHRCIVGICGRLGDEPGEIDHTGEGRGVDCFLGPSGVEIDPPEVETETGHPDQKDQGDRQPDQGDSFISLEALQSTNASGSSRCKAVLLDIDRLLAMGGDR